MSVVQQAWYMFQHLEKSDWKEPELRFAKWMSARPPEPKPTRRLDEIVALLWGAPWYVPFLWRVGRKDA